MHILKSRARAIGVSPPSLTTADAELPPPARRVPRPTNAAVSRRVLLLFSGSIARPDGISSFLGRFSLSTSDVYGGSKSHNILMDAVYEGLLQRCTEGYYSTVFASPPCSTFSVSRFFSSADSNDGGPPPVRDRDHVLGITSVPAQHARELAQANEI
eukprot:4604066-Pleurochrysis_carterae.AAC.1